MTVTLVKQTYAEAVETGIISEPLNLVGLVVASQGGDRPFRQIDAINADLIAQAEKLGATYIFGITYDAHSNKFGAGTVGYGDAFKSNDE